MLRYTSVVLLAFALSAVGCQQAQSTGSAAAQPAPAAAPADQAKAPGAPAAAPAQAAPAATGNGPAASAGKVASIVVLEKQEACECTKTRQQKSWDALQQAMKDAGYAPAVTKIFTDSQAEEAELYKTMRPTMVTPALYFFDSQQNLLEMLQGELEVSAISKVLTQP